MENKIESCLCSLEESQLPKEYSEKCKSLCFEYVSKEGTGETMSVSEATLVDCFSLLSRLFEGNTARAAAFMCQCICGLGWNGDLGNLTKYADTSFSLARSSCAVWKRIQEEKEELDIIQVHKIGNAIDYTLHVCGVGIFKLAIRASTITESGVPVLNDRQIQDRDFTFYEMFSCLIDATSYSLAASITLSVLRFCGEGLYCLKDVSGLERYSIRDFNLHQLYPEISLRLKIVEFLFGLEEERKCRLAIKIFSYNYLNDEALHHHTPLEFIHKLFTNEVVSVDDISALKKTAESFECFGFFSSSGMCVYVNISIIVYTHRCL